MAGRNVLLSISALVASITLACAAPAAAPAPVPTVIPVAVVQKAVAVPTVVAVVPTAVPVAPTVAAPTATPAAADVAAQAPKPRATIVRTPLRLQDAYAWAAKEFDVPVSVLLAVSYDETLWEQHPGQPSTSGGYGVMHLTDVAGSDQPSQHTLATAVKLLNNLPSSPFEVTADELKTDPYQNIRGGAALLQQYEIQTAGVGSRENEADWYGAVAKYSGNKDLAPARAFADQVFAIMGRGAERATASGDVVRLDPKNVLPNQSTLAVFTIAKQKATFTPDCPPVLQCTAAPALYQLRDTTDPTDMGNYALADRPKDGMQIKYIIIHDTESSVSTAVTTFQNPADLASANYIIRSSDGSVIQMVPNQDIAYHARNWYFNSHAIGIEHEGYAVKGATWYSEALYQSSATLVKYLARKYNIPLDRAHIIGHDNVPGMSAASQTGMHWDPGPFWDWNHYMDLLGAPISAGTNPAIITIHPDFANNQQTLAETCAKSGCTDLPAQGSNFVWVRGAPSPDAPLIGDPATSVLSPVSGEGTRLAEDWGDQASTGEKFYVIATQGDWKEIWFGGQKGWIDDPGGQNTVPGDGTVVQVRRDRGALVPLYGQAFPEIQAYPNDVVPGAIDALTYITGGQTYVSAGLVSSDYIDVNYLHASPAENKVVKGKTMYYEIYYNHRLAFLNADDVQVVSK